MKKKTTLERYTIIAIAVLFVVSLTALAAGYSFITNPSGWVWEQPLAI